MTQTTRSLTPWTGPERLDDSFLRIARAERTLVVAIDVCLVLRWRIKPVDAAGTGGKDNAIREAMTEVKLAVDLSEFWDALKKAGEVTR